MHLTIADIEKAWQAKDPLLVDYIIQLSQQVEPTPDKPIREEALTFQKFIQTIFSYQFRQKSEEEQLAYRIETLRQLEADDAEVPLAERYKLHKIICLLWSDSSYYARITLVDVIRRVPLQYGAWKALKHIFKASEANNDYQLLAEISARCDSTRDHEFSFSTALYMRRRAWRYLRKLGENLPSCYPDAASYFLAAYPEANNWYDSYVANHIFYHETKNYGMNGFSYIRNRNDLVKNRAFAELWQRSPEPLLRLLSTGRSEKVKEFACQSLKQDFQVMLRDIDAQWIISLGALPQSSAIIDSFIIWLLKNSSKLEQRQFRELGLHETVLELLHSQDTQAQQYACEYVKAHARDLPLETILRLAHSRNKQISKLVRQLISDRDPRKEIGLEAWRELLATREHYAFAETALIKHFGRKELSLEWFQQLFIQGTQSSFKFASEHLLALYPLKKLDVSFFQAVLDQISNEADEAYEVVDFAVEHLQQLDMSQLDQDFLQRAMLNPLTSDEFQNLIEDEVIKSQQLPLDFYKALAYDIDWKQNEFIQTLKQSKHTWAHSLEFSEYRAQQVLEWLADVRRFAPADLGFDWLMQLVNREEPLYHNFAIDLMTKAFIPADFAEQEQSEPEPAESTGEVDKTIDLELQTFLFTGKLKTMTRNEAHAIVNNANGKISSGVNGKLNYLVIGDEGSPMYGNGRKGSKQVKAEALNADKDAGIKIISETAFLQMMAGEQREVSDDSQQAGCERLWQMAIEKPDTPISKFAITYFQRHHPELCLSLTDRPVDPGAEIPESFMSFEQFEPLFQHVHAPLRQLALAFAHYEFARWNPSSKQLIKLCESEHTNTREFVRKALLDEPEAENKRYRVDAEKLEPSAVYSFCEAKRAETRQLGMQVIQHYEKFQQPDALFQLTESPDREMRAFVVRILWSLYRRYSTTAKWKPQLTIMANMGKKSQEKQQQEQENLGTGLPQRPQQLPADKAALQQLLKRWLYELPPGRLGKERVQMRLKPLSASKAKRALIETFRDVALDDVEFAAMVLPLFENFTQSRGAMEQAACLVAVTRIHKAHPQLVGVAA